MNRALTLALLAASCLAGGPDDAARHREWMDRAQDVKDDLKDALDAKLAPKAVECAAKLTGTAQQEEAYWKRAGQKDALGLARQFRAASKRIESAARAGRFDQALQAYGNLAATCRSCHDLHPEKRLVQNPR
jgi:cytochrome c556